MKTAKEYRHIIFKKLKLRYIANLLRENMQARNQGMIS